MPLDTSKQDFSSKILKQTLVMLLKKRRKKVTEDATRHFQARFQFQNPETRQYLKRNLEQWSNIRSCSESTFWSISCLSLTHKTYTDLCYTDYVTFKLSVWTTSKPVYDKDTLCKPLRTVYNKHTCLYVQKLRRLAVWPLEEKVFGKLTHVFTEVSQTNLRNIYDDPVSENSQVCLQHRHTGWPWRLSIWEIHSCVYAKTTDTV